MTKIYEQFDKATSNLTAVALIYNGRPAGRIVLKFSAATTAYVQIWGVEMTSGRATGGGYDKGTAAVAAAVAKTAKAAMCSDIPASAANAFAALRAAFDGPDDGRRWEPRLEGAGFTIARVV